MAPPRKRIESDGADERTPAGVDEVMMALRNVELPLLVTDLTSDRVLAVNAAAVEVFGVPADSLVGSSPVDFVEPSSQSTARLSLGLVRDGRLSGYSARRLYCPADGTTFDSEVWVRRLDVPGGASLALVVLVPHEHPESHVARVPTAAGRAMTSLVAVTDHDWNLRYVSADAKAVLGRNARDLIGTSLLGMVHPSDAPDFLFAVAEAKHSERAIVCRVRIQAKQPQWRDTSFSISLLCDHAPPRLGILATPAAHDEHPLPGRTESLDEIFTRIALKTRAAAFLPQVPELLDQTAADQMAQLTGRQWEIVTRLSRGEPAKKIAAAMFVSPSTVRNQLSAIYRKFGVHSQMELLSRLRAMTTDLLHDGPGTLS